MGQGMQAQDFSRQPAMDSPETVAEAGDSPSPEVESNPPPGATTPQGSLQALVHFQSHFRGVMEMYGTIETVAAYLDVHPQWFRRCAQPMPVDLIAPNSYALSLGRYGALGHALEPKIGLELLPQDHGVYRIVTVPMGNHETQGYEVDFKASLNLIPVEVEAEIADRLGLAHMTHADWTLDLMVSVYLPRFLQALPLHLIEQAGDGVLRQIVGQVSRRLTRRVQEDFHRSRGLPLPPVQSQYQPHVVTTPDPLDS